ncbi:MAG TPA: thioredoxin domain-containing protein [Candidatus Limnocylindrales bacterium]|nr:thioredoxin domain-containing protein [Candidatus Limnocylindrales bacterium]
MSTEAKVLGGIGLATILIVVVGAIFMGGSSTPDKPTPPADQKLLVKGDSQKITAKNTKVTVVEFGDFQCPACGASHPIVKQILDEYKDSVTFVFRHFPLPMHKNAVKAANAVEAAGAQKKFFEMHDLIYENQNEWSESKNPDEFFEKYAGELKLDMDKYKDDVKSKKFEGKIKADQADGNALGVNSTPTFFINGVKQAGGLPYDKFKATIEEASK